MFPVSSFRASSKMNKMLIALVNNNLVVLFVKKKIFTLIFYIIWVNYFGLLASLI